VTPLTKRDEGRKDRNGVKEPRTDRLQQRIVDVGVVGRTRGVP